eukprot:1399566-Alexandrium_andersonii.AAC.1
MQITAGHHGPQGPAGLCLKFCLKQRCILAGASAQLFPRTCLLLRGRARVGRAQTSFPEADTRDRYKQGILDEGIIPGARSDIFLIPTAKKSETYYIIAGGHLVEALYAAHQEAPENRTAGIALNSLRRPLRL